MFLLLAVIPFVLSLAAALTGSVWLGGGAMAAIPVCTALLPTARHRENEFAFALAAICLIPMNLRMVAVVVVLIDGLSAVIRVLWGALCYGVVANMEQLIVGYVVRWIWPTQKKSVLEE